MKFIDDNDLEQQLFARLRPAKLDEALHEELLFSLRQAGSAVTEETQGRSVLASKLEPGALGADLNQRLLQAMNQAYTEVKAQPERKVAAVLEPVSAIVARPWYTSARKLSSVAAVLVVFGGLSGVFFKQQFKQAPSQQHNDTIVLSKPASAVTSGTQQHDSFMPSAYEREAVRVADEGIVWAKDQQAHRCLQVEYVENVEMQNQDGTKVKIRQPKTRWIAVPVEVD